LAAWTVFFLGGSASPRWIGVEGPKTLTDLQNLDKFAESRQNRACSIAGKAAQRISGDAHLGGSGL
jgi:hypothetical protein